MDAGTGPQQPVDPGRVTMRRLNREEYDNTIRDLLETKQTPGATAFPDDAPELGFDNDGDLQTLSPVQFTLYQQAAESLAAEVMTAGSAARSKLVTCNLATDKTCGETIIKTFGLRAFRRPLAASEVSAYSGLMATAAMAGATSDEQLRTVIEAMLLSPNFLFRPELDPDPTSMTPHPLGPYEIASRLSYTVYRSMPDQALFDAAAAGALSQPADITAQLQRMLADPHSVFGPTFAGQWLGTTSVSTLTFDPKLFPKFTPSLANSMALEVTQFFQEFLTKNQPVTDLLTAKFTYLDGNLASLYGVPAPAGTGLVRTTLSTPQRGGLLTMAAVLSSTSYPTRTSLVKRGNWVLGQLLCAVAPPPPPDVPAFPTDVITATTQKDILLQHRANPTCAGCHESLDNVGIAMENYDAIGAYRTMDGSSPVDASGKLTGPIAEPSGKEGPSFTGAIELAAAVAADPRFTTCVARNLMSYALGRALADSDKPYLAQVTSSASGNQLGVRDLLMNVAANDTFRMRRGEP